MKSFKQFFSEIINEEKHPIVKEYDALKKNDIDTLHSMAKKHGKVVDVSGLKTKDHAITHILRAKHGDKKVDQAFGFNEEVELDEVSASTLRSYIDKSRADKKAAMKDRTAAEKNVKQYGMASDRKERDDAARRVVNRNQGISVANKKLGTYPADKAKAKVMAREEVELDEAKLARNTNTVGAHHLERDSGDHKMYTAYTGSLVRRLHTVTDKDDNILGQATSAAAAMAKAKLKKAHRDALMHDDNQIVKVHDTRGGHNVGTQVSTPGKGKWFKDHEEALKYAKSLPGKIRHADEKGHVH